MDAITVRFQNNVLKKIDQSIVEHNFNSRTEFIREAVRDKLATLSKDDLINEFLKFRGKAKKSTTYEDNLKTKEIVGKELMEELEKQFS